MSSSSQNAMRSLPADLMVQAWFTDLETLGTGAGCRDIAVVLTPACAQFRVFPLRWLDPLGVCAWAREKQNVAKAAYKEVHDSLDPVDTHHARSTVRKIKISTF